MSLICRIMERALCRARTFISFGNAVRLAGFLAVAGAASTIGLASQAQTDDAETSELRSLDFDNPPWSGDLDGMIERRLVRVAVPYGRTLFYHDRGRERGLTVDSVRKFEEHLNKKYKKSLAKRPITILLIPTTRDQLIPALLEGRADIAAGNITITEARRAQVDFSTPIAKPFSEIIVTGPGAPTLSTLDDLAGKEVFVRPSTSYYESLAALNASFEAAGKPPMTLTLLPDPVEDEDKLDMLNAGLLGISAVDEWLADVWSPLLPQVVVHKDLVLRSGGEVGWAFRKQSPKLQAEVDDFVTNVVRKYGLVTSNLKSFSAKLRKTQNAKAGKDWERFQQAVDLFRKYGDQYGFDYLLLAAQGYQESQLDQAKRSPVGAIGIMQLMPATGKEMKVGDIGQAEPNVYAGTKYMDQLLDTYFPDAELDDTNRTLFAFAAYNAGPGRMAKLRKVAADQGYDPNKWFNNVEWVVAAKVGQEPVTYVRNIYKYYVSYRLAIEAQQAKREAAEEVQKTTP
jgi:membrane-bound lytic murein transglycosylase MltF